MNKFLTMLKIEGTLSLRSFDLILFGIGMPAGVFMLIAFLGGNEIAFGSSYTFIESGFASILTVGICASAFMGIPLILADYRDKKILKQFFVTPVRPFLILLVQVCVGMLISMTSALVIIVIAKFAFQYEMKGNALVFLATYLLVMISMFSVGMIIASLARTVKIANVVTSFVYFPMLFLSGATIPFEMFPTALQRIANILPLTHGIKLLKEVSLGTYSEESIVSICILGFFIIAGSIISIVLFKWE